MVFQEPPLRTHGYGCPVSFFIVVEFLVKEVVLFLNIFSPFFSMLIDQWDFDFNDEMLIAQNLQGSHFFKLFDSYFQM